MRMQVTLDVPDIAAGIAFYGGLFGFAETARPHPAYAVLRAGDHMLGLIEKAPGTRPTPAEGSIRDYGRHWTPVHLDFHIDDFDAVCAEVTAHGGAVEEIHRAPGRPPVAFCSDPFGHGFCLLGPRPT